MTKFNPPRISMWRKVVNKIMTIAVIAAVVLAIVPLVLILGDIFIKGASAINLGFLTHLPTAPTFPGGGIANAIVGSFTMVGLAALISIPIGVGAGIFFSEWPSSKLSTVSGFMNDVLTGFPSMVLGLFVFIVIVLTTKEFSAFAGGVALSFVMIPIIARTTDESLKLVPMTLREASMALGIPRWKTVLRVVISTGKNGLLTGILLGVARATGETAPLLYTAATSSYFATSLFQPTASLTVLIYNYGTSPYATWQAQAWGAALVLILIMLGLNLLVKLTIGRSLTGTRMEM
ncbi:MAG: phosphate ABC transporter permease PstA [Candidatus Bathyarchaeia archaeon]|jgi:phosphate transport system permease protein